ncbi:CGNR zinc finger domain-containing protein [Cellulomonas fengjieae]|uniref:CGNR zinc finger domain-containing protein n=1 Tax=Cellulomonas fengjieae TaxID=2819978 RepID=A0ABS3SLU5_9CELL|nr:CGNR zinc finger domain-containing protein [Cellulomonas fengjieae]MBO3085941.1 CGNR zinc finger domain-containing protein [Cellulomonas fengjieae]QVI65987.1 CGNR zinc finger domain-containing protein [Cellulomonas fengjieae]
MPTRPSRSAVVLRDFVNTREPQTGTESLTTPDALRDWFRAHGLVATDAAFVASDLDVLRAIREGVRQVLLGHAGHEVDPAVVAELDRALARVPVRLSLGDGSPRLRAVEHAALDDAVAGLVEAIRSAGEDGSWPRLKVCARDTCRWAFYDESRNQARRWCSMAGCGNHVKMQRAYAARRGDRG